MRRWGIAAVVMLVVAICGACTFRPAYYRERHYVPYVVGPYYGPPGVVYYGQREEAERYARERRAEREREEAMRKREHQQVKHEEHQEHKEIKHEQHQEQQALKHQEQQHKVVKRGGHHDNGRQGHDQHGQGGAE